MKIAHQTLPLWEKNPAVGDFAPYLELNILDNAPDAGCVVILPGGGYEMRADHEGAPVAEKFNRAGFHTAVVQYRVAPRTYPDPQLDALRAIQLARLVGATTGALNPDKVAILGFSAGGHLAACTGTLFDAIDVVANDEGDRMNKRPDAMILCYPVITSGELAHHGSFDNLTGTKEKTELREFLSLENRVSGQTPPTFLWHTAEDNAVPPENSFMFATALKNSNVPVELHLFPDGLHGIGLAETHTAKIWPRLAADFLKRLGF